ncbi:MAG: Maf family protein [Candidatus Magasanikbacteria bacterium]|nr:Maf family protein [Candidatus Magasanikbacteria bacterium]
MRLILGSQSKGRKKMLEEMGLDFDVMAADIDERAIRFADPKVLVLAIANAKAEVLKTRISEPAILITSDQVVSWNGIIREKPENEEEAREFMAGYNICSPNTVVAVVVTNLSTGKKAEGVDVAKVNYKKLSESDIDYLIKNGDIYNLAGGVDIDGIWESFVESIEGTRDGVIGLPKDLVRKLIEEVL